MCAGVLVQADLLDLLIDYSFFVVVLVDFAFGIESFFSGRSASRAVALPRYAFGRTQGRAGQATRMLQTLPSRDLRLTRKIKAASLGLIGSSTGLFNVKRFYQIHGAIIPRKRASHIYHSLRVNWI